jgi:gamma-glutamyl-gamma-aminobutyraldehyde dehydrogenase
LAASIFATNLRGAIRAATDLRVAKISVTCYIQTLMTTPFGGCKHSGFGGRDNGMHSRRLSPERKTIWIDLTDPTERKTLG